MLTPSLPRSWKTAIALGYAFVFLYLVIVMNQLLLGIALPAVAIALAYLSWRLWRVFRMYEQRLEEETASESTNEQREEDAIEALKTEYATGKLSEDEFEAELEQVLADEDPRVKRSAHGERVETERSE